MVDSGPSISSVHRELIYNKGTQAALEFAEANPDRDWNTHDLVHVIVDACWDDIKESRG